MKLASLRTDAGDKLVAVDGEGDAERCVDLSAVDATLPGTLLELLRASDGIERAKAALSKFDGTGGDVRGEFLAPIANPPKIFCIGLNYRDHAEETGAEIPNEPVVFGKYGNTIANPGQDIAIPRLSTSVDFEAELVVVIGTPGKHLTAENALSHVAGYMCGNDVSARDWQKGRPSGQWLLGKTPDGFAPTGPYLVTADEIPDPQRLDISLRLNGETMQESNTREFIFSVSEILVHLSKLITLEPGDLIFTGTPSGVGMARDPRRFLNAGDVTEVEIAGLGVLRNRFVSEGDV